MNKLRKIKNAQLADAEKTGVDPYQQGVNFATAARRQGKLQKIKAQQLAEAEQTGVNPYQALAPGQDKTIATLAHYQAAMDIDIGKIAHQKDLQDKASVKQQVLPTYLPFVDDYVESGDNYPNTVAVQVMIWLLDTLNIELGLNLALHLVKQDQKMPPRFDRDMSTFLCDFFYDWAGALLKEDQGASPYLDTLIAVAEKDSWNVHPLCLSKLYVMLAKHKERTQAFTEALELCEKAEAINPEKAGVKGLKERLQKQLNE